MVNLKVEVVTNNASFQQISLNKALEKYDVRQIVKMDTVSINHSISTIITYVELEDLRELKIENILENGLFTSK